MAETIQKKLNDSFIARWSALVLIALAMFFAYMFVDVMSPLQSMIEDQRGWGSDVFGTYAASEYILNVCGFLILAGIILDKMGVRFTGILSTSLMAAGACVKFVGISEWFQGTPLNEWLDSWWTAIPGSAKMASLGFMIFGCGCEMAGITVSRGIVKWFKGRDMALAMGSEMALARLGVATCMIFSPYFARLGGQIDVSRSVAFGVVLMCIALIMTIVYFVMDKKLDSQTGEAEEKDDPFKISDLGQILTSSGFWLVALLCVLYYSAIFPFQK